MSDHFRQPLVRGADVLEVQVRLFAGIAESLGRTEIHIQLTSGETVSDLRSALVSAWPDLSPAWQRALISVNRRYAEDRTRIQSTDEVAVIPPVGGGSGDHLITTDNLSCLITPTPLRIDAAYEYLSAAELGGTTVFTGTVREWTGSRQTASISYEAYADMAVLQMQDIGQRISVEFQPCRLLLWHRVGHLVPTEVAVVCGAATPHRDAAFKACRTLIDTLKREVPIWKQEAFTDGTREWRENP